jgi:hypothetical protein
VVEVHSEIAARLKAGAVTLLLTAGTTVFLILEPAVLLAILALTANAVPTARSVLGLALEIVVPLLAGAVTRLIIAVLAVKMSLANVPLLTLEMSPLTDSAERMARLAREVHLETVVLLMDTVVRLMTIALLAVSLNLVHVPSRLTSPPTVNAARTGRRAREANSEAVARLRVGAVRIKTTAVEDVSLSSELATQHLVTSPPTLSAGLGTARRVWVPTLDFVVLRMGSAERPIRTAVKAGKLLPP